MRLSMANYQGKICKYRTEWNRKRRRTCFYSRSIRSWLSDASGDESFEARPLSSKFRVLAKICSGLFLLMGLSLWAQDNFVLVTSPAKVQDVCGRHGLTQLTKGSSHGVFLVSTSSVDPSISTDSAVQSFEHDRTLGVPELSGATVASLTQSTTSILDGLPGRTVVNYYGSLVAQQLCDTARYSHYPPARFAGGLRFYRHGNYGSCN